MGWSGGEMTKPPVHPEASGPFHVLESGGRRWSFGGSDYFRLSWNPEVRRGIARGLTGGGVDVAASRVTTGNLAVYGEAERCLAEAFGMGTAVLTASGYTAALVAAQGLAGRSDGVVVAAGGHPCLRDAALASGLGAVTGVDAAGLKPLLRERGWRRPMVLMDGLGALTGRMPAVAEWLSGLPAGGWLVVDDAHGVGTLGVGGGGVLERSGCRDPRVILAFTLSKALGLYGGAVAGPKWLAEAVWAESGAARASTPIPPAYAGAIPVVIGLLKREGADWRGRLEQHRKRIGAALAGMDGAGMADHVGPVFGVVPADARRRGRLDRALKESGIHPPFIRYPGGPLGGLFRFAVSALHPVGAVKGLSECLATVCGSDRRGYRVL